MSHCRQTHSLPPVHRSAATNCCPKSAVRVLSLCPTGRGQRTAMGGCYFEKERWEMSERRKKAGVNATAVLKQAYFTSALQTTSENVTESPKKTTGRPLQLLMRILTSGVLEIL
ncbi:hypothetical protein CDAR_388851 [Caerostris darwini]|uniref:Uncharacterized protein n=1 Tax=Caerostris darwini TaxID=1538125 RepID=A0AAV4S8V0_9ARAC|nr:hypothetical protein CDAR_388851 [Caerostris darwini]